MKKTLAIPTMGSLYEPTMALLTKVGLKVQLNGRMFGVKIEGSDIFDRAIIMKAQDMPGALLDGMADAAIYGFDWHEEVGLGDQLAVVAELNYSKKTDRPVDLVIFGKTNIFVDKPGILVATERPNLSAKEFKQATQRISHGGTEQKVAYGKYDYGVCVTETGDSLRENGLVVVKTILRSPVVLVAKTDSADIRYFGELLVGGLRAAKFRLLKMDVTNGLLAKALELLPALESPTVNQLSSGNSAIETVVPREQVGNLVIKLKALGVTGILCQELELVC